MIDRPKELELDGQLYSPGDYPENTGLHCSIVEGYAVLQPGVYDKALLAPKECRALAKWLIECSAWIESRDEQIY